MSIDYLTMKLASLLPQPGIKIGKLVEDSTVEELKTRYTNIGFYTVKPISSNYRAHVADNYGLGIVRSLSNTRLNYLTSVKKIDPLTPVYVRYTEGNLCFCIDFKSVDINCLLTDQLTTITRSTTDEMYDLFVGEYVYPNRLYHLSKYHGFTTTLEKALKNNDISCYNIFELDKELEDMPQ